MNLLRNTTFNRGARASCGSGINTRKAAFTVWFSSRSHILMSIRRTRPKRRIDIVWRWLLWWQSFEQIIVVFRSEYPSRARLPKLTHYRKLEATRGLGWLIPSLAIKETLKTGLHTTRGNKSKGDLTCVKGILYRSR